MLKFFNGSAVEEEYAKLMQVSEDLMKMRYLYAGTNWERLSGRVWRTDAECQMSWKEQTAISTTIGSRIFNVKPRRSFFVRKSSDTYCFWRRGSPNFQKQLFESLQRTTSRHAPSKVSSWNCRDSFYCTKDVNKSRRGDWSGEERKEETFRYAIKFHVSTFPPEA